MTFPCVSLYLTSSIISIVGDTIIIGDTIIVGDTSACS